MDPSLNARNNVLAPSIEETLAPLVARQTGLSNLVLTDWNQDLVGIDDDGASIYAANGYAIAPYEYHLEGTPFPWSIRFAAKTNGEFVLVQ